MRKFLVYATLVICLLSIFSCTKDENVSVSSLVGKWTEVHYNNNLSVDGYINYTFNEDNSFVAYSYDALSNKDTTVYGDLYIVSNDSKLITLYTDSSDRPHLYRPEHIFNGQYEILTLKSDKMVLWDTKERYDVYTGKKKLLYFEKLTD